MNFNPEIIKKIITSEHPAKMEFTVKSKKTGNEFTYKIVRKEWEYSWYTHCYVENNYQEYSYIGHFIHGGIFKKRILNENLSAVSLAYIINKLDSISEQAEFYHLGKCLVCGRTLTDSESIENGIGLMCAEKINNHG